MEAPFVFWLQFVLILICIAVGGRFSGIGLGAAGGFGLAVLTLFYGLPLGDPPVSVIFIIMAVITCVSILQGTGGLDFLVAIAEKILRKKPNAITFLGPLVCYIFTVVCGTSYVAFSVYPVIAEIAIDARIRPERAMSMSVIASNMAIPASPTSAIIAAMIGITAAFGVTPLAILAVTFPACLIGVLAGCFFVYKRGAELEDDPEFCRRVACGEFQAHAIAEQRNLQTQPMAKRSLFIFLLSIAAIFSSAPTRRCCPNSAAATRPPRSLSPPSCKS